MENTNGVTGTDILLAAYSRGSTANIYTRPISSPSSRFFDNIFSVRQETDIWLHGSYWDNQLPTQTASPTTEINNNTWRFYQKDQQTGRLWP